MDCPVCATPVTRGIPANIAPFLRQRCGIAPEVQGRSNYCERCEHVFFTPLLTSEELERLYAGYRGAAYNRERVAIEPTYAEVVTFIEDEASPYFASRNGFYDTFLSEWSDCDGLVVDFGGGDGYFSRRVFPKAEVIVVEESFERDGGDLDAVLGRTEILFCAHVFEHLPQPLPMLQRLVAGLRKGARVWIELPTDYVGSLGRTFDRLEARADSGDATIDCPFQEMHEHVAHYSKRSAKMLMSRAGLVVDEIDHSDRQILGLMGHRPV